jgi:structural maintenance of chromosome 3 (chondroitin sulfate proteoglycan 6)
MHIKLITIFGFKSYKEQTAIEAFSPRHNVIVGRNGSGKSNFFAAIRFVLGDAYHSMSGKHSEERHALLHEGSGSAVVTAYVEIIFDNTDDRFPTGKPELILRRTIGVTKDEYSLDRKNASRAEVMSLLESAGFSSSNPYYIVPQGRVTALTNMKDPERLDLLKSISGTQVYEARKKESKKIMEETQLKKGRIDELLAFINERLGELEEEKDELRQYQEKDRQHRCLQYVLHERQKQEYQRKLDQIDDQRSAGVDETDENRELFLQREQDIAEIDEQINELKQQLDVLQVDRGQLEDDRKDRVKARAKIELEVSSLTQGQSAAQQAKAQHDSELRDVQRLIKERETELAQLMPEYNAKKEQEAKIGEQLEEARATQNRLRAKQSRSSTFKSKRERDEYLKKQVDDINATLATRKALAMQTSAEVSELEAQIGRLETEISDLRSQQENRGENMQTIATEVDKAKEARDRLMDERKELWREDAKLDSALLHAREEHSKAESFLQRVMDHNTWQGIKTVRRIKQQQNLEGVYGTLGELFVPDPKYQTAIEVTAGQSLFHYVVDTEETASHLTQILTKEKAGRVTFMPLSRLRTKPANIPKASDAVHMVSKMQYDEKYDTALQYVFGKTIVCPNLQVAGQYARSHGISAITPEGDRAEKKGSRTGGYHDPRQSRLEAAKREAKWRMEVEAQQSRKDDIRQAVQAKDQEITRAVGEVQKIEQKRQQLDHGYGPLQQELRNKSRDLQNKQDQLETLHRKRQTIEQDERKLGEDQQSFETEMASAFQKVLSQDEERQIEKLTSTIQDLRKQYSELNTSRSELETRKMNLDVELRENLRPKLDQLVSNDMDNDAGSFGGPDNTGGRLKDRQRELKRVNKALADVESQLAAVEESIEQHNTAMSQHQQSKDETTKLQEQLSKAIEHQQKSMNKNMQKKAVLAVELAAVNRDIRELGALPEEAFDKYQNLTSEKAIKRLHKVKEDLKKYSHVNKKAYEQYTSFTKQRETLDKRRSELDTSDKSISDLISHLDDRKDEAIERTFKQVSKEFATVFEKLVPAGKGRLVIQRKSDRQNRAIDGSDDDERNDGVENYTGVGISVSFNSKHDEQQRIQQLSGGQKSKSIPSGTRYQLLTTEF